jgi:hypothetical protein
VGAREGVGVGCADATTVGTVAAWDVAGTALGSGVAYDEGTVEGFVDAADPVSSRVDEIRAPLAASGANRGLDDTNSPASTRTINPTVA